MTPLLRELAARCSRLLEMRDKLCERLFLETVPGTREAADVWNKYNAACTDCIMANEELAKAMIASMPKDDSDLAPTLEASLQAVRGRR